MASLAQQALGTQTFEAPTGEGNNGNATVSLSTTQKHSGAQSLKLVSTAAADCGAYFGCPGGVGSLQWVTISGWIYSSVSGIVANFAADWKDGSFGYLSGLYMPYIAIPVNTWTYFSASGQTVAGTANFTPTANFTALAVGNTVYFDDFTIAAGVPVPQPRSFVAASRASLF